MIINIYSYFNNIIIKNNMGNKCCASEHPQADEMSSEDIKLLNKLISTIKKQ